MSLRVLLIPCSVCGAVHSGCSRYAETLVVVLSSAACSCCSSGVPYGMILTFGDLARPPPAGCVYGMVLILGDLIRRFVPSCVLREFPAAPSENPLSAKVL